MKIRRRLGIPPAARGSMSGSTCPDLLELDSGDFLVIGKTPGAPNITARELAKHSASIGPGEQAVILPRAVLLAARADIPEE